MDKSDKILAAIEQLAQNLTGQIAAVDAKLTGQIAAVDAKLTGQIAAVRTELKADIARVDAKVGRVDAKVDAVATVQAEHGQRLERLESGQARIMDHLDVAELRGRVDEQGRTIAQLIPTRVAAVPGR
ncbi:hypothetical protein WCLP8_3090003 [uncultured Gammaproteobacteria bacterium]